MFKSNDSIDELKIKAINICVHIKTLEKMKSDHIKKNFFSGFSGHVLSAFTTIPLFNYEQSHNRSSQLAEQIDIERVKLEKIEQRIAAIILIDSKKDVVYKK